MFIIEWGFIDWENLSFVFYISSANKICTGKASSIRRGTKRNGPTAIPTETGFLDLLVYVSILLPYIGNM